MITGGTSGIGLATATAFLREGARVVVVGRDQKKADQAKALLGEDAVAVRADVAKLDDLDALYGRVRTPSDASTSCLRTPASRERRFPWRR